MHPATTQFHALNQIQQATRSAELQERAQRHRGLRSARRSSKAIAAAQRAADARVVAHAPLTLAHGFFGREHGSHA